MLQLILSKISKLEKNEFNVASSPPKSKMASVPYSNTAKKPTYQISAHLVKVKAKINFA